MKRILLASTALVAFAGAAVAEGHTGVTFTGSATLGYNDTDLSAASTASGFPAEDTGGDEATGFEDNEFGFYSDIDITIGLAAELDNGLMVGASIDLVDLADGAADGADYELSLTSETAGLYYGNTNFAAQNVWVSAGDMSADGFSEQDGEAVLRGEVTFGSVAAQVSYLIDDTANELAQLSVGASADFGNFNVVVAYQEAVVGAAQTVADVTAPANFNSDKTVLASGYTTGADFNANEVFGISVGTTFGAADVRLAYADDTTQDSFGVSVSYPFGPVVVDASYTTNSVDGDKWDLAATYANGPLSITASTDEGDDWALEGSYDVGNGLTAYAGVADAGDDFYVAGSYDLGSGASVLVSYAEDGSGTSDSEDEIGANDYQEGATVELTFAF